MSYFSFFFITFFGKKAFERFVLLSSYSPKKQVTSPGSNHRNQGTTPTRRKVSFLTERSSENSLSSNEILPPGPEVAAVLSRYESVVDLSLYYGNEIVSLLFVPSLELESCVFFTEISTCYIKQNW